MWWLKWLLGAIGFIVVCGLYVLAMGMCKVADEADREMGAKE